MTWRDKQAARRNVVLVALEAWYAAGGSDFVRMANAIDAYNAALTLHRQCDEPGCEREANCGFAVDGGYRRTCYEHSTWAKL